MAVLVPCLEDAWLAVPVRWQRPVGRVNDGIYIYLGGRKKAIVMMMMMMMMMTMTMMMMMMMIRMRMMMNKTR